jgi:hypothetical protein
MRLNNNLLVILRERVLTWNCFGDLAHVNSAHQIHFAGVDLQNVSTGLLVRSRELNLSVNAARSEQSRIQDVNSVSCHNDFDVFGRLKTVQLIQQFQHCALNFRVT